MFNYQRVPTICKAYFLGLWKGISPENMAKNMVLTYLQFRILEFPLIVLRVLQVDRWMNGLKIIAEGDGLDFLHGKSNTWGIDEGHIFHYFLVVP